jgi:hypothetical protein
MHRHLGLLVIMLSVPAAAADAPKAPPPAVVQTLLDCRGIDDAAKRLACLDAGVAALAGAVEKRDVVVTDRAQVNKARRGLFGLAPPGFPLFGGDPRKDKDDDGDDRDRVPTAIDAVLTAAQPGRDGNWRFTLDDGSRWVQTDALPIRRDPRAGMKVRIRAAAMGSYLANIEGQIAVRVKRLGS